MNELPGWTAGLANLTDWLAESDSQTMRLELLLENWVRDSGWSSAGLLWPLDGQRLLDVATAAQPPNRPVPVELVEGSKPCTQADDRLWLRLRPPGLSSGAIWVVRGTGPWTDREIDFAVVSAALIERSPALRNRIGAPNDDRLTQRLADVSVIAGRMAHDFDNLLTGVLGFADLLAPQMTPGTPAAKYVAEIGKIGQRGTVLTRQLHELSRSGQVKPQPGNVIDAVAIETDAVRGQLPIGGNLVVDVPRNLPTVAMESVPLRAVVRHLLENAVQAAPPNTAVRVVARAVDLSLADARAFHGAAAPGRAVELSFADVGPGVAPSTRPRLFAEPFFTTKVRHRGLGLAVAYRTLTAHRGGVRIDSASPGPGTVARAVIPTTDPNPTTGGAR